MTSSMPEETTTTALVIGGGWSGLYAMKYLRAEGIDCRGVERRDVLGGLWAISKDTRFTSVADCTYTSSPKLYTEATDYPWPEEFGLYPRYDQVHAWLQDYARHFGLAERYFLNTNVVKVEKVDGLWHTYVTNFSSNEEGSNSDSSAVTRIIKSKYLIVSTGVNFKVNDMTHTTKFTGFMGTKIHANDIRYVSDFEEMVRDKVVVAMGGGEGASDLSYFGSLVAKSYTLCIPNGQWMQVRNYLTRMVPIHKIAPVTIEKLIPKQVLPWEYQKCVMRSFIRPMWGSNGWDRGAVCSVNGAFGHGKDEWRPVGPCYSNFGNKADLIHHAVSSGRVRAKRDVIRCEGNKVFYCDGTVDEDVDMVLLCTGYKIGFPFLPQHLQPASIRDLYKNIFHTEDPTLCFVGFSRPTQGSIPQIAELASYFVAQVAAGHHILPSRETMKEVAKVDRAEWEVFFRYSSGRVTGLVDGIIYCTDLSDTLGISFGLCEVLFTYGWRDWMYYLYSPSTVHTFLGKIPSRKNDFLHFIRESNLFVTSEHLVYAGPIFALCDIFYHQLGRLENFYNETFDPLTRRLVQPRYYRKESVHEKWWLTKIWDAFCVALLGFVLLGYTRQVGVFLVVFSILLLVVHTLANQLLKFAARRWARIFTNKYPDLMDPGANCYACPTSSCYVKKSL